MAKRYAVAVYTLKMIKLRMMSKKTFPLRTFQIIRDTLLVDFTLPPSSVLSNILPCALRLDVLLFIYIFWQKITLYYG